jgi:hypothetical protein
MSFELVYLKLSSGVSLYSSIMIPNHRNYRTVINW